MGKTLIERLTESPEGMRLFQQERAIQEATDLICEVMELEGVSRAELARRLNTSKGYITQLLDGRTNMTVRTISDVFGALNRAVHFQDGPLSLTIQAAPLLLIQEGLVWGETARCWPTDIPTCLAPTRRGERMAG